MSHPVGIIRVVDLVEYPDVVAVRLPRLSAGAKRGLWRARQLQSRCFNWGWSMP